MSESIVLLVFKKFGKEMGKEVFHHDGDGD